MSRSHTSVGVADPTSTVAPQLPSRTDQDNDPVYQPPRINTNTNDTPGSRRGRQNKKDTKKKITILPNNCATMAPKATEIAEWPADIIALQETRLGNLAQLKVGANMKEENWQTFTAKPWQPMPRKTKSPRQPTLQMEESQ